MNNSTILLKIYLQDLILLKSEKSFFTIKGREDPKTYARNWGNYQLKIILQF